MAAKAYRRLAGRDRDASPKGLDELAAKRRFPILG
jgi:hypothetical protein